jgi:GTP cyclohydrolase I
MSIDRLAAERAIGDFLRALGVSDDAHPDLADTPRRVVDAYVDDLLSGYSVDLERLLAEGSEPSGARELGVVVIRGIDVTTLCPHHLMPSMGEATVAYLPGARLLGLGTVARLLDAHARRLSLQENIGERVVDALVCQGARGAYCKIELSHSCLSARGARQTRARVTTVASKGELARPEGRAELQLALEGGQRG